MTTRALADPAAAADAVTALVTRSFTASEGPEEGRIVGGLAEAILTTTPGEDLRVFVAEDGGAPIAAALFSRLSYPEDPRTVFILAPMAVVPDRQGQGEGQALLRYALQSLRKEGVDVAITYGDPAFYGRVGFLPVTAEDAAPPMPLSLPHGWIAQSLDGQPLRPLKGASHAVPALNKPEAW